MSERYNGWSNHATWCTYKWLTGDASGDRYWREQATRLYCNRTGDGTRYGMREVRELGLLIESSVLELLSMEMPPLFYDLLQASLAEVNWRELATEMLSNVEPDSDATAEVDDN